jgi:hypothetical protein
VQHSIWIGNFAEKPRHGKVVVVEGMEQLKNVIPEAYAISHGWAPGVARIIG